MYCNPFEKHYMHDEACPRFSFRMREITGREIGDEVITTFILPVSETVGPYDANEWNKMFGVLKITEHIKKQTTIFMFIERAKPGYRIIIDDVRMGKVIRSENDRAYNRGFESGDTRFWHTIGPAKLDIVDGGHDGSNYALKAHSRGQWWASMEHELNQDTLVLGHSYAIKAKIKLELSGSPHICVPGLWWGLEGRDLEICPTMTLRQTIHNSTHSEYSDFGVTVGQWDANDWNDIYGVLEVTQDMLDAPAITLMFTKLHESIDLIIDDVSVTAMTDHSCDDLIWNGGGEIDDGKPYYWKMYGTATVDVVEGGMGSDYALHVFERTNSYDGVRQLLDHECVHPGAVYEVTAWVKMLDSTGAGYECIVEQTFGDGGGVTYETKRCPLIAIGAQNPGGAPQHRAVGSAYGEWAPGEWNLLKGHFKFFANEINADSLFVSITQGPADAVYHIDNVSMTIFRMPTEMPSIAPSANPTASPKPSTSPSASPKPSASSAPSHAPTFSPRPTPSPTASSGPTQKTG